MQMKIQIHKKITNTNENTNLYKDSSAACRAVNTSQAPTPVIFSQDILWNTNLLILKKLNLIPVRICCATMTRGSMRAWRRSDDKFWGGCIFEASSMTRAVMRALYKCIPWFHTCVQRCRARASYECTFKSDKTTQWVGRKHVLSIESDFTHSSDNHTVTVPDSKWPAPSSGGQVL